MAKKSSSKSRTKKGSKSNSRNEETLLITIDAVAEHLCVSPRTVFRLVKQKKILAPVHVGNSLRWVRADFENWVAEGCRKTK